MFIFASALLFAAQRKRERKPREATATESFTRTAFLTVDDETMQVALPRTPPTVVLLLRTVPAAAVWLTHCLVVLENVALTVLTTVAQQKRGFLVAQMLLSAVQLSPYGLVTLVVWADETATMRAKARRMVVAFILRFYLLLIKKLYSN